MRIPTLPLALIAVLVLHSPAPLFASKILLISSGDASNDAAIESVLQSAGDTVTVGPTYSTFTGSGLSGYNAVFLNPNAGDWTTSDMPVSGQQALLNYVDQGGGLVTSAMVFALANPDSKEFQTLVPALPAVAPGAETSNSPITFTSLTSNSTINAGLPSTFSFPAAGYSTEALLTPKLSTTGFFATNQWTATFGGEGVGYGSGGGGYGAGRILSLSTFSDNLALSNAAYDQMLVNALNWAGQTSGGTPVPYPDYAAPEPTSLLVFLAAGLGLLIASRIRRTPRPSRSGP
jgi:type 1 glutamine amidotransferase